LTAPPHTMTSAAAAEKLTADHVQRAPSILLFALTLGLSKPPREFGISAYSTQLLPRDMARLSDYAQGAALMAEEPGARMPPMSIVDYAAIDSGVPAPPYVLSIVGPDLLSNWDSSDMEAYREKRDRWQQAIVRYLDSFYPGLADGVVASSFNTALSVRQYLNAPDGAVYGFAPTPPGSARHWLVSSVPPRSGASGSPRPRSSGAWSRRAGSAPPPAGSPPMLRAPCMAVWCRRWTWRGWAQRRCA